METKLLTYIWYEDRFLYLHYVILDIVYMCHHIHMHYWLCYFCILYLFVTRIVLSIKLCKSRAWPPGMNRGSWIFISSMLSESWLFHHTFLWLLNTWTSGFQLRAEPSIVGQSYHLQDDQLNLKISVTSSACFCWYCSLSYSWDFQSSLCPSGIPRWKEMWKEVP